MKYLLLRKPMFTAWLILLAAFAFHPAAHAAASNGLSLAKQLNEAFVEVAERVSASVVVIQVEGKAVSTTAVVQDAPWLDDLPPQLRRQFEEFFGPRRAPSQSPRRHAEPAPMGQGSGVVIREDGFILTNGHVVEEAEKITVRFKNGKTYTAKVQSIDSKSDMAVIKIEARGLPVAKFADSSKTRVGEFAIAIGAPFALDYSVTVGHVSAKGRSEMFLSADLWNQDFIQTDASINPGNSGGPLVNLDGEVIGINTLIRGMNTGIGFAVPSNLARRVADELITKQKVTRSYLGIGTRELSDSRKPGVAEKGLEVKMIQRNGPAASSTLELGDVILSVDGSAVGTLQELRNVVGDKPVGANVKLDVLRDGKKFKVTIKTGELPDDLFAANRGPRSTPAAPLAPEPKATTFGLKVQTITPQVAKSFKLDATTGVVVTQVERGSPAEALGFKIGVVISKVDRTNVKTAKEFYDALAAGDAKKGVAVTVTDETGRRLQILQDDGD